MASGNRWESGAEPIRYPDPDIKVLDPRFQKYVLGNAAIERIAGGCRFNEGPVWFGDGRYLLWSDIPNDRIMKWEEETGAVSVFRRPSNYANGNTRDRQGRLVTCEMDAQRLTRTEYDGTRTANRREFCSAEPGGSDGLRVDTDGNIWCAWGGGAAEDGVAIYAPRRHDDRPHHAARALRQRLFRRPEAQPPLHGRQPVG